MSIEELIEKIDDASEGLKDTVRILHGSSVRLSSSTRQAIENYNRLADQLFAIKKNIRAREVAVGFLNDMLLNSDLEDNTYNINGSKYPFDLARLMLFQGLLSSTWSAYDGLTTVIGKLMCSGKAVLNTKQTPQLWQNFTKTSEGFNAHFQEILRREYGYPIALSYIIRNHLIHDCGQNKGKDFFQGVSVSHGFKISDDGWNFVDEKLRKDDYSIATDRTRVTAWPPMQENLLSVLSICHHEIDNSIIILLNSSVNSVGHFVKAFIDVRN